MHPKEPDHSSPGRPPGGEIQDHAMILKAVMDNYHFASADIPVHLQPLLETLARQVAEERTQRLSTERLYQLNIRHLEASQRMAHIGCWELYLDENGERAYTPELISDETYRLLGVDRETEVMTRELFYSRIHPDDRALIYNSITNTFQTGAVYDITHRVVWPDGTQKVVHQLAKAIVNPDTGKVERVTGTMQDITERVMFENALQQKNDELKKFFESTQEVFFSVDMITGKLIHISPACQKVYGYTVEAFEENPNIWSEVILIEDMPIILANYEPMYRGEAFAQVYRIRHKDGSVRWLESKLKPTVNDQGDLVRLDGVTADVTQRKMAEIALQDSEYRFRSLIEHASDAIMIVGEDYVISYASDSLLRIMGYEPNEVVGVSAVNFIHPDDHEMLHRHMSKVLSTVGVPFTIEYRRRRKDGVYLWCEGSATNLLHVPSVKGVVVNFRDITERKQYTEQLKASNEQLSKTNMELDRFVYSVSHDLRAPLSSMQGILNLMTISTEDELLLSDLQRLKGSVLKLDGFILDILDYSRNARLDVKSELVNFEEKIGDCITNLKFMDSKIKLPDLDFEVRGVFPFYSDRSRIKIILNNLVSNAIRYSKQDAPESRVHILVEQSETSACIVISDNGIGISEEHQERVFDMFYRVSHRSMGSGLGLYIVKETVEKLKGRIEMKSTLGQGTIFTITLPNLYNQ